MTQRSEKRDNDDGSDFFNQSNYRFKNLEDEIIKYICEKIVSMREQPFIEAVNNLRKD